MIQGRGPDGRPIIASLPDLTDALDRPPRNSVTFRAILAPVGAGLAVAVAFAFWNRPQDFPPGMDAVREPVATVRTALPPPPAMVAVHVSGAVLNPGLVVMASGSRVADAIAAAGGGMPGSNLGGVNLAAFVTDGMRLTVPWIDGDPQQPPSEIGSGEPRGFPVDLNRAGSERLAELPGVGEVLATRIITHRETHGPFESLEDLLDVPGIGEGKLAGLRDYAVVGR